MKNKTTRISMINNRLTALLAAGGLMLSATSCRFDEQSSEDGGEVSNGEVTLTYGEGRLSSYMSKSGAEIPFHFFGGNGRTVASQRAIAQAYEQPDLTDASVLSGNTNYDFNQAGKKYYIPEGETYTGRINYNTACTVYVLGTWGGNQTTNVGNGGVVEVAPSGAINGATVHLNSGSKLENFGYTEYKSNSSNGEMINHKTMTFTGNSFSWNASSSVKNYCTLIVKNAQAHLNTTVHNYAHISFEKGFLINGNGRLQAYAGTFVEVLGGTLDFNGRVQNDEAGYARFDISNTNVQNVNANPAINGAIDVNFTDVAGINKFTMNNQNRFGQGVTIDGDTYIEGTGCIPAKGVSACNDDALKFTLLAQVSSPVVNNTKLSATGVSMKNGFAYVSYHTNDEVYGSAPNGALRVFNVENQSNPSLISQAIFNDAEFNGVSVSNNTAYAVGGNRKGAKLVTVPLNNNTLSENLSAYKPYALAGVAAKNGFLYEDMLWTVAGGTSGGFFKLNPEKEYQVASTLYADGARSKYVAQNGTYQAFFAVASNGAYLRIANVNGTGAREYTFPALKQTVVNGKNAIAMDEEFVYVALSDKGVAKFKLENGELAGHFEPNRYTVNGANAFRTSNTNAVAVNGCYVYLANGNGGVIVLNKNSFAPVGHFQLPESVNYIYAEDGIIFVATGRDGLNIIKIN